MSTVAFGFSATPAGTGCADGTPDPARVNTLPLTNGLPAADLATSVPASTTIGSPTPIWTGDKHAASPAAAMVDLLVVEIDPARANTATQNIAIRPVYTRTGAATVVNGAAFEYRGRDHPPFTFAGTVVDGTGVMYLSKIEAANASTTDATLCRVKGWK